jgi:hypothetical protein
MDALLIKNIALSTLALSFNIALTTEAMALSPINHHRHQLDTDVDTTYLNRWSEHPIFSPVVREYEPPDNGTPEDAKKGAGSR